MNKISEKIKYRLFTLILIFAFTFIRAITIDSLLLKLETENTDSTKINILNDLSSHYNGVGQYSEALQYAMRAQTLSEKINYKKGFAQALNNVGKIYENRSDYRKSYDNYMQAVKIFVETGDKAGLALSYNGIGNTWMLRGSYENAMKHYLFALSTGEEIGDKNIIAKAYNNIGLLYEHQRDYAKAMDYFRKSLSFKEDMGDLYGISGALNNLGNIYKEQKNYEKAMEYYSQSLSIKTELGNKQGMANSLYNIGNTYVLQGNYAGALKNLMQSLSIGKAIGDQQIVANSSNALGQVYLKMGKTDSSHYYLTVSLGISEKIQYREGIADACSLLSALYAKKNDHKQALLYQSKYYEIKDSLLHEKNMKQIAELQIKYETEKKETEIKLLNKENEVKALKIEEQQYQINISRFLLLASILSVIFISVFGWLLINRNKLKQRERLKTELLKQQEHWTEAVIHAQEEERKRIAQNLHDGIGQNLASIKINFSNIANAQDMPLEKQKLLTQTIKSLDDTSKEVRSLSHQMMPKTLKETGLADAMGDLLDKTLTGSTLKYNFEKLDIGKIPENIEVAIYRVFQELLSNILNHAHASEILVHLHRTSDHIILMAEDNGVGINFNEYRTQKGIGLSNIEARIYALKGTFSIRNGALKGTIAIVRIPV